MAKPETVPKPDAQRWKLELPGTSEVQARDLVAAVESAGWTYLQTRTEHGRGVVNVFMATNLNTAPEQIAEALVGRMTYRPLPHIWRMNPPTTWAAIRERLERTADGRDSFTRARAVVPTV